MTRADVLDTTCGIGDEARTAELVENAARFSKGVWSKPAGTLEAAIERAKVAFYWNADTVGEGGSACFAADEHLDSRERANAELIKAVLALD